MTLPLEKDRRKQPRADTYWRATLRTLRRVYDCRVVDISREGAQVRLVTPGIGLPAAIGEIVMLTVSDVGRMVGVVAWLRKNCVGIHITNPRVADEWAAAIAKFPKDANGRVLGTKQPAEPGAKLSLNLGIPETS
jgi:PilZ domain-containing protein